MNVSSVSATLRMSPSASSVSLIGLPLTWVPLVLPKSRTSHMPLRSKISACSRETSTDSTRKSAVSARPMRNGQCSIVTRRASPLPSEKNSRHGLEFVFFESVM